MKYFSFCLFDGSKDCDNLPFEKYLDGFIKNCKIIKTNFPDFKIVLYADIEIQQIIENNNEIITNPLVNIKYFNNVTGIEGTSLYYRYNILSEPFEIVIVRDAHHILTNLDIYILNQWIVNEESKHLLYLHKSPKCQTGFFDGICGGGFATKDSSLTTLVNSNESKNHFCEMITFLKNIGEFNLDERILLGWLHKKNIIFMDHNKKFFVNPQDTTYITLERYKIGEKKYCISGSNFIIFDME